MELRRWVRVLSITLAVVGAIALMVMMCLVSADVILRDLVNKPIMGSYELVEYLMIPAVFLAVGFAQVSRRHLIIDIVVEHVKGRPRALLECLNLVLALALFLPIAWVGFYQTEEIRSSAEVSSVLLWPRWPFQALVVVGAATFCLTLVLDLVAAVARVAGKELEVESGR